MADCCVGSQFLHCPHSHCLLRLQRHHAISLFRILFRSLLTQSLSTFSFGAIMPTSCNPCTCLYLQIEPFIFSSSNLTVGPLDPPPNFLPTCLVPWVVPYRVSSAPVGFVHNNGTAFLRQYLVHPASPPIKAPSLLVLLGRVFPMDSGLLHWRGVLCMPLHFMVWGGTLCVPVVRALCTLFPHNTTSAGPCRPDPEEDMSGLNLCHGVHLVTSHPHVVDGGVFWLPVGFVP